MTLINHETTTNNIDNHSICYTLHPDYELVKSKSYTINNEEMYKIMTSDHSDINDESSIYHSVIFTMPEKRLLSFSPPNTMDLAIFRNKYPEITHNMYLNEIIEGTMINLFFDHRINQWVLSTRSSIGGNYWYYRTQYHGFNNNNMQPTFRQMFIDALHDVNSDTELSSIEFDLFDTIVDSLQLPRNYCYSFIIQHPANHIVQTIYKPTAYLVAVYEINGNENTAKHIPVSIYRDWPCIQLSNKIRIPKQFDSFNTSYTSIMEMIRTMDRRNMGIMITHMETGDRTMSLNPVYEDLKILRGNHPNLLYHYLDLKKNNKVIHFLIEFPIYKQLFYNFDMIFQGFVTNIHNAYVSYYVKKSGEQIPKIYFIHVYNIHHNVYLKSMKKIIIKTSVVDNYMTHLETGSLYHYLSLYIHP